MPNSNTRRRPSYAQAYTVNRSYDLVKKFWLVFVIVVALPSWTHAQNGQKEATLAGKHKYLNLQCANEIDLTAAPGQRRLVTHCEAP